MENSLHGLVDIFGSSFSNGSDGLSSRGVDDLRRKRVRISLERQSGEQGGKGAHIDGLSSLSSLELVVDEDTNVEFSL
jgi:hypothetical protein